MSDELKELPIDFETHRPSQEEINAAVVEITARLKAADNKDARIAELEAEIERRKVAWDENWMLNNAASAANGRRIAELEKGIMKQHEEIQRLRDGIGNAMLCDSVVQMHECLTALLGGGE